MSLLMDALKKAEKEKKKAAKRLEQVETNARAEVSAEGDSERDSGSFEEKVPADQSTETSPLSLEPIDLLSSTSTEDLLSSTSTEDLPSSTNTNSVLQSEVATVEASEYEKEIARKILTARTNVSEGVTLENPISQEELEKTQDAIDLNDTTIIDGLSTESASAPFDDTFHGVLFEGDDKDVDVYEETLPGVPADQLIKDIGGGENQPTPVAAQTVFTAGRNRTNSRYGWGAVLVLVLLAAGSFAVFYYFTITPVVRKLPSPAVARGIESTSVPVAAISQIKKPDVISGTIINTQVEDSIVEGAEQFILDQEPAVIQEEIPVAMLENEDQTDQIEEVTDDITSDVEKSTSEPVILQEAQAVSNVSKQPGIQQAPVIDDMPETFIQAEPELMKISKNASSLKQNIMISEAFKAYQSGQFDSAESLYRNVLQDEPENRDVHLGLAAIAINKGDRESAYTHYLKLLDTNPGDALAISSLISLSNNSDPVKDESMIKTLIHKEGKVPYLYFALGNIYAKQLRWAEAQQAFFNAYSLDSTNPDYVLNLAISLDKIGQFDTALDFYSVAIELAQHSPARFNMSSVNDRIRVLNKVVDKAL